MTKLFKYIALLMQFRDISRIYIEERGKEKPFWLSRRFIGAVITACGAAATVYFGVTISTEILTEITSTVETILSAAVTLYGLTLTVVGLIKRHKKA